MNDPDPYDDTSAFSPSEKLAAEGQLVPGSLAGAHVIVRFIARGGGGSVYEAHHPITKERVAVKVLHQSLAVLPKVVERFSREVQIVNRLRHPNIVEIHDVGALPDGRPFYVMEYLEGQTVHEILRSRGRLTPKEAREILEPVCAALAAAHAQGVIHRDVKASNIHVLEGEPRRIKLLDFGIAKLIGPSDSPTGLTSDGRQIGTATSMAPEQFTGGPVDLRIDIYALGILLYRLLTGRVPFDAQSVLDLARQHMEAPPPAPSQRTPIPASLDAIVLRCLEKLPERRFDSVADLMSALISVEFVPVEPVELKVMGLGIHVELRIRTGLDELDQALSEDIGLVLDRVEETLKSAGFLLANATGTVILGVRPLPVAPQAAKRTREEALRLATSLHDELLRRPDADARVHVNICLHVADIAWKRGSEVEIAGGELLRTESWAPTTETKGVSATPEFVAHIDGFETMAQGARLMNIASQAPAR